MTIITGRVVTGDGTPIAGARVMIVSAPVATPDVALLTGPDGGFVIGAPAPGRYVLRAIDDAHGEARGDVVAGAADAAITLRFPPG